MKKLSQFLKVHISEMGLDTITWFLGTLPGAESPVLFDNKTAIRPWCDLVENWNMGY